MKTSLIIIPTKQLGIAISVHTSLCEYLHMCIWYVAIYTRACRVVWSRVILTLYMLSKKSCQKRPDVQDHSNQHGGKKQASTTLAKKK